MIWSLNRNESKKEMSLKQKLVQLLFEFYRLSVNGFHGCQLILDLVMSLKTVVMR